MPGTITVEQAYDLGTLTQQSGSLAFVIKCTPDPATGVYPTQADVVAAMQGVVPSNTVLNSTWGYQMPLDDLKVEHITDKLYTAEAIFKRPASKDRMPEAAGPVLDFDTSGGSQHIIVSKAATVYVAAGTAAPPANTNTVIGADGKRVHGVDIGFGVYRFSEEWTLPDTAVPAAPTGCMAATACTPAYRAIVKGLTFRTNAAPFRGFAIGEVLFEGANGRRVKGGAFSVTYKFAVSPNATGLAAGDITGIQKTGWQYLDVKMKDSATAASLYQVPAEARVHTVYEAGDFGTLAIGTGAI